MFVNKPLTRLFLNSVYIVKKNHKRLNCRIFIKKLIIMKNNIIKLFFFLAFAVTVTAQEASSFYATMDANDASKLKIGRAHV